MQPDNHATLFQTVAGSPGMLYTMSGYAYFEQMFPGGVINLNLDTGTTTNGAPFDDGLPSPTDFFFALEFLDSMGAVLPGSVEIELMANGQMNGSGADNEPYTQHILMGISPAGTTQVRVRATMTDGVANPSLPSPQVFRMSAFVDDFSLTAEPAPMNPGDFDNDGDVDGNDFLAWQRGNSPNGTPGGPVSAADLLDWQNNYGPGPLSAATAVPEPSALALLVGLVGLGCARSRSRRG
jgi:hypothetical protein